MSLLYIICINGKYVTLFFHRHDSVYFFFFRIPFSISWADPNKRRRKCIFRNSHIRAQMRVHHHHHRHHHDHHCGTLPTAWCMVDSSLVIKYRAVLSLGWRKPSMVPYLSQWIAYPKLTPPFPKLFLSFSSLPSCCCVHDRPHMQIKCE